MKIVFASDHAGFEYKKELIPFVQSLGHETTDVGAHTFDEADDYPEFMFNAAREVAAHTENSMGVLLGGSGQGEAMVANRFRDVRAVVYNCENLELIRLAREHNNANVLSIGARFVSLPHAKDAIKLFLETLFTGEERHVRRLKQLKEYS